MRLIIGLFLTLFLFSVITQAQYVYPKRELRGVWIAAVGNIDWPSSNNETSARQIKELKNIFSKLSDAGINTAFFQVRTECDALYDSPYEPWSYWLTGEQGKAPNPFYDPLKVAVAEAHSRGIEIQAWLNPLRVMKKDDDFKVANNNIMKTHPGWILEFGRYKMLNPGIPDVRHYIAKIVGDIVRRYNVDGIHFDDYFYPYTPKIKKQDYKTFLKYNNGIKDIGDWRRNNINEMIAEVHDTIDAVSGRLKFGISPFGIIENKYAGTKGFEAYNVLYCDPLTWIKEKSIDYLVPQLYWELGHSGADYRDLLLWWASISNGVQLYIGNYSTRMAAPGYKGDPRELEKQLKMNRQIIRVDGTVYFSAKSIVNNYSGFSDSLKAYFKYPSLIPAMLKKDSVKPLPPENFTSENTNGSILLKWNKPKTATDGDTAFLFVIYRFREFENIELNDPTHILKIVPGNIFSTADNDVQTGTGRFIYAVTSVDNSGNESKPSVLKN